MAKKTVRDIDVRGKRVLVRVDFNVPLRDGEVADDTRLRAALPTIEYLLEQEARIILVSHLGRPKGRVVDELRMDPVARRLEALLGRRVAKVDACVGREVAEAVARLNGANILMLENVRFYPEEEKNDPDFARELASLADVFVNDAFGTAHRAHASTAGVAAHIPAVAGFLLAREIETLSKLLETPAHPLVVIVGGAKIADKIRVLENLLGRADRLIIGGGMANTFLAAQGHNMEASLVEENAFDVAISFLEQARQHNVPVYLPVDFVAAPGPDSPAERMTVPIDQIPAGWMALDIGRDTLHLFQDKLKGAGMIFWNGPMGVFENPAFEGGTLGIAEAVADSGAVSIVGGGDTVAAVRRVGVEDRITHISTGGGAALKFLEGRELPGIAVLQNA
ncbi:MAG: phosphoglycerate kinase [Desulfotomaculales bacterium]